MGEEIKFPGAEAQPAEQPEWLKTAALAAQGPAGAKIQTEDAPAAGPAPETPGSILLPWSNPDPFTVLPGTPGPWFSLAAIVGNEAHHIERFFEAFEPLVDEIILVRAIGTKAPDRTFEIAQKIARKPLLLAEYKNDPNLDWDHVDNFASARQRAFELARGRFVMWADADDILDPENLQRLRSAVDLGNFDVLLCNYRVIGSHPLIRERVIKKGVGRWVNACHEAVSIPDKAVKVLRSDIEIFHYPIGDGMGKSKVPAALARNLRILEHSVGPSALAFFYLHRDSLLKNDQVKSVDWGKMAVNSPNLTPAERYRVFFNMALIFLGRADWTQMETFAMNGIRQQPDRRECFCVMAISHIERKNFGQALIWIQLASCINPPDMRQAPNWFEPSWYGWRHHATHAFILRKMKLLKEADVAEDIEHDGHPMISLLHATRGRASQAIEARERWLVAAMKPGSIEHIYAIDADDKQTLAELEGFRCVIVEPGGGCVRAWNAAAAKARGRVLIQMSDDWAPPYHWDNQVVWRMQEAIEKKKPAVLAISDGHRKDKLLAMAILTREYYLRQREEKTGQPFLFHPDYLSMYSDNEFTVRAYENGVVIEAKDLVFTHEHPLFTGAALDSTYVEQNAPARYDQGLALFNRRNPRYKIDPADLAGRTVRVSP